MAIVVVASKPFSWNRERAAFTIRLRTASRFCWRRPLPADRNTALEVRADASFLRALPCGAARFSRWFIRESTHINYERTHVLLSRKPHNWSVLRRLQWSYLTAGLGRRNGEQHGFPAGWNSINSTR